MSNDSTAGGNEVIRGKIKHTKLLKKFLKLKRKVLSKVWLVRIVILIPVVLVLLAGIRLVVKNTKNRGLQDFIKISSNFIFAPKEDIKSADGRVNILLLGTGGESHEGGDLTDTMMLVSVPLDGGSLATVSIPRDLWIPEIRAKINSAYYWGNQKKPPVWGSRGLEDSGGGLALAKATTEKVLGIPVHYGAVLDFSAFEKIIDDLGGIDVDVENAFTDTLYPIAGREDDNCEGDPEYKCRYETISFVEGINHMSGKTALKFVRSRYSDSPEGTDIAREARQQKVVEAVKSKVLSPAVFLNIQKDIKIWKDLDGSIVRDIDNFEAAVAARYILKSQSSTRKYLIPEELIVNPPVSGTYDYQYVFIPKAGNGNWTEVGDWIFQTLEKSDNN